MLADNIQLVREISRAHQAKVALERDKELPSSAQTRFHAGDFVLERLEPPPRTTRPPGTPFFVAVKNLDYSCVSGCGFSRDLW